VHWNGLTRSCKAHCAGYVMGVIEMFQMFQSEWPKSERVLCIPKNFRDRDALDLILEGLKIFLSTANDKGKISDETMRLFREKHGKNHPEDGFISKEEIEFFLADTQNSFIGILGQSHRCTKHDHD
jgi:hypothetical protein